MTETPLLSAQDHQRQLIQHFAATLPDLRDLGYGDHTARRLLKQFTPTPLAPDQHRRIPPPQTATDLVTLVPSGEVARTYWPAGAYLRDLTLRGQVRLRSAYLATDTDGRIPAVYPITARYRIGSAAALRHIPTAAAAAAVAHPETAILWPGQAWYYELGDGVPLDLDLGYARTGTGGAGALAGVQHHHLTDLQALASAGGVLKGRRSV